MVTSDSTAERTDRLVAETETALEEGRYPLEILNDPDLYDLELRRVFGRSWINLGHTSEFEESGDVTTKGLYFDESNSRTFFGAWCELMGENGVSSA